MRRHITVVITAAVIACLSLFLPCSRALAQLPEEKDFLSMYFKEEELVVLSTSRTLKSISRVAENVKVVTAAEIELLNAHTLADVLNTVTGVQVWMTGGPGQMALGSIQGSEDRHMTVFIDGVALNNLGSNNVELGVIPVQNIEKIEIIKGPASSSWGSALGGVVNIITRSGSTDNQGGMLSASYGTKNTGDFRAEARGKQDRFGYYLTAGRLQSDGLTTHMDLSEHNAYTKLVYGLTDKTNILFTFGYQNNSRNTGEILLFDESSHNTWRYMFSTLAVTSDLNKDLNLDLSIRAIRQKYFYQTYALSTGLLAGEQNNIDRGYGSSAKLTWKNTSHTLVAGVDYDNRWLTSEVIAGGEHGIRKWALFLNDTLSFKKASITPGIRYEHTSTNGDIANPSLGLTYAVQKNTILRLYAARGFSIPSLGETFGDTVLFVANPDLGMEKVTSYQTGVETAALKYIWMKVSAFRNEIRDAISSQPTSTTSFTVNAGRQRRQGFEIEVKTAPVYHFSLSAGWEYIDAKDLDTDTRITGIPTRVYDLAIHYDDERTFRALLNGRYINWNADPLNEGSYDSPLFDLSMIKKIYQNKENASLEAFGSIHNIFNGSQYLMSFYKNPDRWFEAGVRCSF